MGKLRTLTGVAPLRILGASELIVAEQARALEVRLWFGSALINTTTPTSVQATLEVHHITNHFLIYMLTVNISKVHAVSTSPQSTGFLIVCDEFATLATLNVEGL